MKTAAWVAFGMLSVSLLALTLERVAERGRFAAAYSSYGSGPLGSRALYLLIEELHARPQRWAQDLARLPERAVLVALGGCDADMARPLSRYERQELVRWVRAGGVLIVAGARDYLPQAFGVRFVGEPGCAGAEAPEDEPLEQAAAPVPDAGAGWGAADAGTAVGADAQLPPGETTWGIPMAQAVRGLPVVPFHEAGELLIDPDSAPEILLGDPRRDAAGMESDVVPLAVALRHGLGRVIVLASGSMLQNRELANSDGAALFLRLLQVYASGAPVLFDEYHLGIGERRSLMRYLRQMGAAPLALQLLVLAAVFFWRAGARFGGLQSKPAESAPDSASYVLALGRLYERAADPRGALLLIAREAWARIASQHHVEPAPPDRLAAELSRRGAHAAAEAVREVERVTQRARNASSQPARLPALVAEIDAALAQAGRR